MKHFVANMFSCAGRRGNPENFVFMVEDFEMGSISLHSHQPSRKPATFWIRTSWRRGIIKVGFLSKVAKNETASPQSVPSQVGLFRCLI